MTAEKSRNLLQSRTRRIIRLVPTDLPPGCSAAWFGGVKSDWIGYPRRQMAASAVAHVAAHLILLHCGSVRDGGRFVCMDTQGMLWAARCRIHAFLGQDDDEVPGPLFTSEEEQEADELAAVLLARCGRRASIPAQSRSVPRGIFRCVG